MDFFVQATITPKAAAKLLLSGEINLDAIWNEQTSKKVFDELLTLSIDEALDIVDRNTYGALADVHYVPQFGKLETVTDVPSYFVDTGTRCADYPQLGFFLKPDVNASLVANTKFGENHGKAAAILGIANCINKRIVPSALSYGFMDLNQDEQKEVVKKLLFKIPAVQIILCSAKNGVVNGYDSLALLKESTMRRRSQCLRAIFRILKEYNHPTLNNRIENITWEVK